MSEIKTDVCIIVLLGLPASGKTTFSRLFKNHFSGCGFNVMHICYDEFIDLEEQARLATSSNSDESMKERRQEILTHVERFLKFYHDSKSGNENQVEIIGVHELLMKQFHTFERSSELPLLALIDDNCYYNSMRYEYCQLARTFKAGFCQFFIDVPVLESIRRNASRSKDEQVPDEVIKKMSTKLEAPDPLTNPWERFSFSLKLESQVTFPSDMCKTVIDLALSNPVLPFVDPVTPEVRDISRRACTASVVHQADKILRKKLNALVLEAKNSGLEKEKLQEYCKQLNSARTEAMEDLKTGFVKLPVEVVRAVEGRDGSAHELLEPEVLNLFSSKTKPANTN